MAIIRQGGYTDNDSSDKLRDKRKKVIEEERIFQLNESLLAYLSSLLEKFDIVHKSDEKNKSDMESSEITYPNKEELEKFTRAYSETKPKGF